MEINRFIVRALALSLVGIVAGTAAAAQTASQRLHVVGTRLQQLQASINQIPASRRKLLSASVLNLLEWADKFPDVERGLNRLGPAVSQAIAVQSHAPLTEAVAGGLASVSNPGQDIYSVLSGFTQSETDTAWCGSNIVVGFNDSGSIFESLVAGVGGLSVNGYSRSANQGGSYVDLKFLNPGSDPNNFLAGDPVLGCADANTFYYASLFETGAASSPTTAVSLSKSTDGGMTFADPVEAVAKDGTTHFLDKDWMAVDPTDPRRLYVTYTDFDSSGVCGSPKEAVRIAIELVRSTDGGSTWSAPVVIDQVCSPVSVPGLFVQGSQVTVDTRGKVYVAWEFYAADYVTREIRSRKSNSKGATFEPIVKVSDVVCSGDCSVLQGGFRASLDIQSMAVDRSPTATKGTLYVAWHDGRFVQFPDLASPTGFYQYADVLLSRSSDGGATWSRPVRVNQNPEPLPSGRGTDQYMPGVAVDNTGRVEACFYDRQFDPDNFFFDRSCALSGNGGESWTEARETASSSPPIHAKDTFINVLYLGDYDGLTSDFTGASSGFVGAFQMVTRRGDPNLFAVKLP